MSPSHTLFPLLLLYRSTDNPPGIPAFTGSRGHRTSQMAALTSAVTQMAQVMTLGVYGNMASVAIAFQKVC